MKYIKILVIILLILTKCMSTFSYAIDEVENEEDKLFFSSDKLEAERGETVTLTLDLSLIEYDNFEFILTSNIDLQDINTEEGIDTTVEENELKIISNKSQLNINKISFYYEIPETLEIGSKITLKGIIQEYETENEKQEVTITIEVKEKEEDNPIDEEQNNDEQDNEKQDNQNQNNEKQDNTVIKEEQQSIKNVAQITQLSQSRGELTTSNSSNQEVNVYNGESNNYLSSLVISGYDINPQFNKTNNTYFITVDEDITNVDITAIPEDENAKVNIYGNDNIQEGENKVLISVTAENGEVKTYRIYIIK